MTVARNRRMPPSQRSRSVVLRRSYSATSGCGRIRKRSASIASMTRAATSSALTEPSERKDLRLPEGPSSIGVRTPCGHRQVAFLPAVAAHAHAPPAGCHRLGVGSVQIGADHAARAFLGEAHGQRLADAAGGPRDDDHLVLDFHAAIVPYNPCLWLNWSWCGTGRLPSGRTTTTGPPNSAGPSRAGWASISGNEAPR